MVNSDAMPRGFRLVHSNQGDRMSLRKKCAKM
jgi:hypothetical protein